MTAPLPLAGVLVVDCARMLPGAVLARLLLDLGARVIKVEDPASGDPMRHAPPMAEGVGAGFAAFYRGAESIALDLKRPEDAQALRDLAAQADVLVESFRPGTMDRWGLGYAALAETNPGLVYCSLSGFGARGGKGERVGHDLNFVAASGLLSLLAGGDRLPGTQFADVASGMLAATSVIAALFSRTRTGRGTHVDQPLAVGPMPFLAWPLADAAAGGGGMPERVLAGRAPAYRCYACQDGVRVAVGALEPKFWVALVSALELPELAGLGLDLGEAGEEAATAVAARFASRPSAHWLAIASSMNLPISVVQDPTEVLTDPYYKAQPSFTPTWAPPSEAAVPGLGADTARLSAEFGLSGAGET